MNLDHDLNKILTDNIGILSNLEKIIYGPSYNFSTEHKRILSLQSVSLLYSVWEGFISNILRTYIDYINHLELDFSELNNNIVAFSMISEMNQFVEVPKVFNDRGKYNSGSYVKFYNDFKTYVNTNPQKISYKFNTESNVGFDVLNKLLDIFYVEKFKDSWDKYKYPNKNLPESLQDFLNARNKVAHGVDILTASVVDKGEFELYRKLITDLMYEVVSRILQASENSSYKKQ